VRGCDAISDLILRSDVFAASRRPHPEEAAARLEDLILRSAKRVSKDGRKSLAAWFETRAKMRAPHHEDAKRTSS
jgi:hypothetical protein